MTYRLISSENMTGLDTLFKYVNASDITGGWFIKLLLLSLWIIIAASIYIRGMQKTTEADLSKAAVAASFITLTVTFMLRLLTGLVDNVTYGAAIAVAVISLLWLFSSRS